MYISLRGICLIRKTLCIFVRWGNELSGTQSDTIRFIYRGHQVANALVNDLYSTLKAFVYTILTVLLVVIIYVMFKFTYKLLFFSLISFLVGSMVSTGLNFLIHITVDLSN